MTFGLRIRFVTALCAVVLLSGMTFAGDAPVADAAMRGDRAQVRALLKQGADVNAAQGDGMTALHWAAEHGDAELAAMLITAGANRSPITRIGNYTPLHIAAKNGSAEVAKLLLKAGVNVNATTSTSGATSLHFAAASGSAETVTALLEAGADPNAKEAQWGQTPLVFAASYNRPAAIKALLAKGADPKITTKVVNMQEDAQLDAAATRRRNEVLNAFRPADKPPGWMPTASQIQAAISSGRTVYMNRDTTAPAGRVEEGDTADGAIPGFAGQVGKMGGLTALHHAVRQGNTEAVLALLDGGADINVPTVGDRVSPLLLAAINGQFDIALKLVERGADAKAASALGDTPLYATLNTQWSPRSRFPQPQAVQVQKTTHLELMEALLEAGADPNVRLRQHLWYFAYNNCGNANCGLENIEGTTPFWRAAYAVDVDAMKLLVKHGANPNVPSQRAQAAGGRGGQRGGGRGQGGGGRGQGGGQGQQVAQQGQQAAQQGAQQQGAQQAGQSAQQQGGAQQQAGQAVQQQGGAQQQQGQGAGQQQTGQAAQQQAGQQTAQSGAQQTQQQGQQAAQQGQRRGDTGQVSADPQNRDNARLQQLLAQRRGQAGDSTGAPRDSAAVAAAAAQAAAQQAPAGIGVFPIHAAAGVGYGNGFAGNSHRHAPDGWLPAMKFLVEELGADVNARDNNGYTPLHHAAARGDNEMILYLVSKGADVTAVARNGRTTVDMANGPVQRLRPFLDTVALLEKLGAKNNHRCVSC
jgi:uncharacterized protein